MIVLDTDTVSMLFQAHPQVSERYRRETEEIVITVVTRIEALRGRFDSVMKAADGTQLLNAQQRLEMTDSDLLTLRRLSFDIASAAEFDRLRQNKKLKKIGRGDLLIACIALAHRAKLVTRNLRDFRQVPGLQVENWATDASSARRTCNAS
jgi:tRNA(fMet)-specific endonuclease VapC